MSVTSLHGDFIVSGHGIFNLCQMVVSIGQGVMHVGWLQARILLHNLFYTHSLPVTAQNDRYTNPGPSHDGLPPTTCRVTFNVSVVEFGHGTVSFRLEIPSFANHSTNIHHVASAVNPP